jgi:GNAT superfamily N-acetyltransferase
MIDRARVAAMESRLVNAWPAFEVELAEGWLLRFAEGYSKRANAATPLLPDARLDPDLVRHMLDSFEARGIAPCFRLTGIEHPECDAVLADLGLSEFDPSLGMVADLPPEVEIDPSVRIERVAKRRWIADAAAAQASDRADPDRLGRIVRSIRQPAAFATLSIDGEDGAWGLAVAERGYVGLYDIVVGSALRGLGLGRRLVASLMAWGRGTGAATAYLQVREANAVATGLYASLGFSTAYRYTHRVLPPAGRPEALRPRSAGAVATSAPAAMSTQASASDGVASA